MTIGNRRRGCCSAIVFAASLVFGDIAWGHVFPVHATPGAGAVLHEVPANVVITFDGLLEPIFSTLRVEDANGHEVAKAAAAADRPDATVLEVKLPALSPGVYHVYWSVVARDGHHTMGDYKFTLQ